MGKSGTVIQSLETDGLGATLMSQNIEVTYVTEMTFLEFLEYIRVLRMLYGVSVAEKYFTSNKTSFNI